MSRSLTKKRRQELADAKLFLEMMDVETRLELATKLLIEKDGLDYIYFMKMDEVEQVKIGITSNPSNRLVDHQVSCPAKLRYLAVVPYKRLATELALHKLYGHLRKRGEWFEYGDELKALLENLDNYIE